MQPPKTQCYSFHTEEINESHPSTVLLQESTANLYIGIVFSHTFYMYSCEQPEDPSYFQI